MHIYWKILDAVLLSFFYTVSGKGDGEFIKGNHKQNQRQAGRNNWWWSKYWDYVEKKNQNLKKLALYFN